MATTSNQIHTSKGGTLGAQPTSKAPRTAILRKRIDKRVRSCWRRCTCDGRWCLGFGGYLWRGRSVSLWQGMGMCDAAGFDVERISCRASHASSASRVKPASYSYQCQVNLAQRARSRRKGREERK